MMTKELTDGQLDTAAGGSILPMPDPRKLLEAAKQKINSKLPRWFPWRL